MGSPVADEGSERAVAGVEGPQTDGEGRALGNWLHVLGMGLMAIGVGGAVILFMVWHSSNYQAIQRGASIMPMVVYSLGIGLAAVISGSVLMGLGRIVQNTWEANQYLRDLAHMTARAQKSDRVN